MNIVAIIQARMGSTRLPGKVLRDLAGEPMLARVVNRTWRATTVNEVVVATTTQPADRVIAALCAAYGWSCFRGSENDVLDRYYQTAIQHQAEIVVRITSDCPLVDPGIVDWVVGEFCQKGPLDYASNALLPKTFLRGLDVEVIAFDALECAWREDQNAAWREHVTPYIYRHPEKFRLLAVMDGVHHSSMRWTVDTPEDLTFVRCIYDYFGHDRFSYQEVLTALQRHPEWLEINRHIVQKAI